jgi:hypothetical protein
MATYDCLSCLTMSDFYAKKDIKKKEEKERKKDKTQNHMSTI